MNRTIWMCAGLAALTLHASTLSTAMADDAQRFVQRAFYGGLVKLMAPAVLKRGDSSADYEEMVRLKYGGKVSAAHVLIDYSGAVNIVVRHGPQPMRMSDLPFVLEKFKLLLRRERPGTIWHEIAMRTVNGHKFVFLDYTTAAIDTKIRNLTLMSSARGRMLAISFNFTQWRTARWLPLAKRAIASIKVGD